MHIHSEFSEELSGAELLRGRTGRKSGLNSKGERTVGRERLREGLNRGEKRWEVRGGAWKGP